MEKSIDILDLSFKYEDGMEESLKNITGSIGEGEIILLTGDSGSGKSTLLKCINGLIPRLIEGKISGKISLEGKNLIDLNFYEINKIIATVFQNPRTQFFNTNTSAELVFAMENYSYTREKMDERIEYISNIFDIKKLMDREIFTLSSGERQMFSISTALALNPRILLFDEPSANLDYRNAYILRDLILTLKKNGITCVISEHRYFYLKEIIDRVMLVEGKTLTTFSSEKDFLESSYSKRNFDLFNISLEEKPKKELTKKVMTIEKLDKTDILDPNISFDVYMGEVTSIVGVNGVGKTTLARMICKKYKKDVFYIMQDADYQLFGTSVFNELKIGKEEISDEKVEEVLKALELWEYRNSHPFSLSGGQKQRLQIGMAILSNAKLIILDEPTSGLDAKMMNRICDEVCKLSKNSSILIISHDYEFIVKSSDRIIYLKEGKIRKDFELNSSTKQDLDDIFQEMRG